MAAQERAQLLGHGEGEHEVVRRQAALELAVQPLVGLVLVALRTVAVAAGAGHGMLLAALGSSDRARSRWLRYDSP